jgi:predicted metal-dependent hydrolase
MARVDGKTMVYTIKRSPRAIHVRLEVNAGTGLTVVIPMSYQLNLIPTLLNEKSRWIVDKLAYYGLARPPTARNKLKSGDAVPYLGHNLKIAVGQYPGDAGVKLERKKIVVNLSPGDGSLDLLLEKWYRAQAAGLIKRRAERLSARLGLTYGRLTIRGQRTRWGSCSQTGNISFNWRLIMAPGPVIDYVIIHELAHRKEMNHTRSFWQLVAVHCPRWQQHRRWLRDHEAELASQVSL